MIDCVRGKRDGTVCNIRDGIVTLLKLTTESVLTSDLTLLTYSRATVKSSSNLPLQSIWGFYKRRRGGTVQPQTTYCIKTIEHKENSPYRNTGSKKKHITLSGIVAHFTSYSGESGVLKCILARWNEKRESDDRTMEAANQNRETNTVFVDVFVQRWWKKCSSACFVVIIFFRLLFSQCAPKW